MDKKRPLPGPATGVKLKCRLRLGSVINQGYGRFKAGGEIYMARRFAWQQMGKPDPGALRVSTRCSNKLCVRHLSTRTRTEIMASVSRRWALGEASHLARFSSKQVLLIRKLYAKGNVTQSALAERFGMSTSNMKGILARALLETHLTPRARPQVYGFSKHSRSAARPAAAMARSRCEGGGERSVRSPERRWRSLSTWG